MSIPPIWKRAMLRGIGDTLSAFFVAFGIAGFYLIQVIPEHFISLSTFTFLCYVGMYGVYLLKKSYMLWHGLGLNHKIREQACINMIFAIMLTLSFFMPLWAMMLVSCAVLSLMEYQAMVTNIKIESGDVS